jgi:hypothetical protein
MKKVNVRLRLAPYYLGTFVKSHRLRTGTGGREM